MSMILIKIISAHNGMKLVDIAHGRIEVCMKINTEKNEITLNIIHLIGLPSFVFGFLGIQQ